MGRSQLAINIPAPLLERLRAAAAERGVTYSSLVLHWIEAGLDAGLDAPKSDLDTRLDALEQRLDALATSPVRVIPATPKTVAPIPHMGDAPLLGADGITTAELALKTCTNRAAWNTWASKATPGDVRHHPQAGSWQLIGKAAPASGGPERWLWRLEAAS